MVKQFLKISFYSIPSRDSNPARTEMFEDGARHKSEQISHKWPSMCICFVWSLLAPGFLVALIHFMVSESKWNTPSCELKSRNRLPLNNLLNPIPTN